jgi:hypothetical protein
MARTPSPTAGGQSPTRIRPASRSAGLPDWTNSGASPRSAFSRTQFWSRSTLLSNKTHADPAQRGEIDVHAQRAADKRRILEEAAQPDASLAKIAPPPMTVAGRRNDGAVRPGGGISHMT